MSKANEKTAKYHLRPVPCVVFAFFYALFPFFWKDSILSIFVIHNSCSLFLNTLNNHCLAFCWLKWCESIVLAKSLFSATLLFSSLSICEKRLFLMFFWKLAKGEPSCSVDSVKTSAIFSGSETNFSLSDTYSQNQASCTSSQSSFFCNAVSLLSKSVIWTFPSLSTCISSFAPPYSISVLRVPFLSSFIFSVFTFTSAHKLVSPTRLVRLPATVFINWATAVVLAVFEASLAILIFPCSMSVSLRFMFLFRLR